MANRNRTNLVQFYLSDDEQYILNTKFKASGMKSMSTFLRKKYTKERIRERIEMKRERKSVIPKKDYSVRRLIDTSDEKFQNSPGLQQWATIENLKIATQSYNEVGSLSDLKHQITVITETGKSAKQSVVKLEHRMKDLAEIIKYAEQYKTNRSYHIAYKSQRTQTHISADTKASAFYMAVQGVYLSRQG